MSPAAKKATHSTPPFAPVGLAFLGTVFLQGFHELEHVVQVLQRFVFHDPKGAGILGTWLDMEPVHIVYNGSFLLLISLCFWAGGFHKRSTSRHPLTFWLMSFALLFQSYHFVEHIFKIVQFIDTGLNGTPGILGHSFNLVWLHFTYNTIVYLPLLAVFFLDGYYRSTTAMLRNILRLRRPGLGQA